MQLKLRFYASYVLFEICVYRENENLMHAKEKLELELKLSKAKSSSSSATSRLKDWIRRDEISEAYEFDSTYDGTIGKEALIFREAMINFVEDVKLELGTDFNEKKAVRKMQKALTGEAKIKLANDNKIRRTVSFIKYILWYDDTFQLKTLRDIIYKDLMQWKIKSSDSSLKIVDNYITVLKLLEATDDISTPDVVNATQIPVATQVSTIIKAFQHTKPKLFSFVNGFIMNYDNARAPKDLKELKKVISRGVQAIASAQLTSDDKKVNELSESDMAAVNAINLNQFPQFSNSQYAPLQNQSTQNNPNRGNFRGRFRGRGRSSYPNQGNRGGYRGGYSNYRGNQSYRGRGSRSRRGGYRSNRYRSNRGYGRRRGGRGYNPNRNNNNNNRDRSMRPPYYFAGYCGNTDCGQWGHKAVDCDRIHREEYKALLQSYLGFDPKNQQGTQSSNMVNTTQLSQEAQAQKDANDIMSSLFSSQH